jgi:hypothetical protein
VIMARISDQSASIAPTIPATPFPLGQPARIGLQSDPRRLLAHEPPNRFRFDTRADQRRRVEMAQRECPSPTTRSRAEHRMSRTRSAGPATASASASW